MMKTLLLFALFLTVSFIAFSKSDTLKFTLLFDNNQFLLTKENRLQIETALQKVANHKISNVLINGHTDNTSDSAYNMRLSEKRAVEVETYLVQKGLSPGLINTNYSGEIQPIATNETYVGKRKNRRVEVFFCFLQPLPPDTLVPVAVAKSDSCNLGDTVIILAGGTQLVFDLCEYRQIKDCIEFTEILTTTQVLQNGLTLMDINGYPIASCGMISINVKEGCADIPCFKKPVKVRLPKYKSADCDQCNKNANVYGITGAGTWTVNKEGNSEIRIIEIDNQEYYQFAISCPNKTMNCDCRKNGDKIVIKTKRKYRIIKLSVAYECPVMVVDMYTTKKPERVNVRLPCLPTAKTVKATILDEKGDTLLLPPMPLNDLKKRAKKLRCGLNKNEVGYKWLGVFPVAKREIYGKYIIRRELLVKKHL